MCKDWECIECADVPDDGTHPRCDPWWYHLRTVCEHCSKETLRQLDWEELGVKFHHWNYFNADQERTASDAIDRVFFEADEV